MLWWFFWKWYYLIKLTQKSSQDELYKEKSIVATFAKLFGSAQCLTTLTKFASITAKLANII